MPREMLVNDLLPDGRGWQAARGWHKVPRLTRQPEADVADSAEQYFSLPVGTRLEEYEIISVLGHGSFGLTYVAEDTNLGTRVAIKEYLPGDCAFRDSTQTVRPRSSSLSETLERGKEAFLKEARILALVSMR